MHIYLWNVFFKTMGGFVSLAMDKKRWDRKKRLYSRLRSFSTSTVWIFWAKQCSKSSTTIIPYKHHHVHRPTAIHQTYKTNMKSAIKMKKVIRSMKDFFNLTKPLIREKHFLFHLGDTTWEKCMQKHLIIKRMRVSKYGILAWAW
jgi:hypothetical protein